MSEQDWQVTVLAELGIPLSGLMASDPSGRPLPSPVPRAAGSQSPTGGIPAIPLPEGQAEGRPHEEISVIGGSPVASAERTAADPFGDHDPIADQSVIGDQSVIADQPVIGGPVQDERAIPFVGLTGEPAGQDRAPHEAPPPRDAPEAVPSATADHAPQEQPTWGEQPSYPPAEQASAEPTDRPAPSEPLASSWDQTRERGGQPSWEQSGPSPAEQKPPVQWEQSPPQLGDRSVASQPEQEPAPRWEQSPPPQGEQSPPSSWGEAPPSQWEQAPPPLGEQAAPPQADPVAPPGWDQAPPQGQGGQPSWDQGGPPHAEQEPPPQWEQNASPQWEQNAASQEESGPPPSSWEPPPQVQWDQAAQPSWGTQAAEPQDVSGQPGREAWPSGSEAWQQDPGAPPQQPVHGSAASGPPSAPGPSQVGPPVAGGPMAARDLVRRSAYGDPLVRRMSRGVRRAVGAAAANDVRKAADVEAVLSRPVPSCRQIAITSIRGGAGKTTVAGLTATVIAQYRQDRVLAVDADSGLGSLPLRMGVGPQRSLHDMTSAHPRSFEEASRYLAQTTDGLWVLSGTAGGRITGELDLATFRVAAGVMSRYFAATVIDCGAGLLPELQRGILADAHAQVMVTPGTVDGALSAHGALEWQARNGYEDLLPRTVIAFVTHTPHVDADLARAGQMLSSGGLPVVHIPYDRHLAAGTAVESARIGHETRAAVIRIAVEAFARAVAA
ncbi:hypothetical protein NE236_37125 [Actinoallomurus purpureus]|uniref:nucleotide-binding protein n=1 Tax=Actinoallomurus purpureus TaxID=478114 RepID=UPI002092DA78|nr:hypothetical protein [Actinoallomurus purpureus]MCO6010595.1 hypothetical protein [Actinoallomurus purpureus]